MCGSCVGVWRRTQHVCDDGPDWNLYRTPGHPQGTPDPNYSWQTCPRVIETSGLSNVLLIFVRGYRWWGVGGDVMAGNDDPDYQHMMSDESSIH